jgi:hypothetical protein
MSVHPCDHFWLSVEWRHLSDFHTILENFLHLWNSAMQQSADAAAAAIATKETAVKETAAAAKGATARHDQPESAESDAELPSELFPTSSSSASPALNPKSKLKNLVGQQMAAVALAGVSATVAVDDAEEARKVLIAQSVISKMKHYSPPRESTDDLSGSTSSFGTFKSAGQAMIAMAAMNQKGDVHHQGITAAQAMTRATGTVFDKNEGTLTQYHALNALIMLSTNVFYIY